MQQPSNADRSVQEQSEREQQTSGRRGANGTSHRSLGQTRLLNRLAPRQKRRAPRIRASTNIKIALLATSVLIVIGTLLYSHRLVEQLKTREYRVVKLFSDAVRYYSYATETDDSLYRMIVHYTAASGVPVILSDRHKQPSISPSFSANNLNIPLDSTLDSSRQIAYLRGEIARMDRLYPPIEVTFTDPTTREEIVTNYVHYGDSLVLGRIESLPFIQLLLGAVVVFVGYLSFSYLKRSEQSNIWVGMAKETAHQLGTPLSSLLGWTELLKLSSDQPQEVRKIADEINLDIERLNRIAIRFSKIGSIPDLKPQNIVPLISAVMGYLEGRLPHLSKNIKLELDTEEDEIMVPINRELFEWVFENLIKNAFEAIETMEGKVSVVIRRNTKRDHVVIDVCDNGKGFDMKLKKDIFRPGFSTKARGWGLGLSLARRIVQDYHHGRLFVKESAPGKGTTFRVRLRTATAAV